ncbi:MAG: hypothetical protein K2X54_16095 [Methylobacterium organophilum]|nr:hypothetical protein [Methylobacterium organophilum]
MNQAFFDPASGQIWMTVGGQLQPYQPGTLTASFEAGGMVAIRRIIGGGLLAMADASTFVDCDGHPFADAAAALAYLQGEFARRPAVPDLVSPYVAAADLGGHRVVCAVPGGVDLASSDDAESAGAVIGLTTAAAAAGTPVPVVTHGPVTEPSWSFAIGPVYLGRDGLLIQDPPATGCVLRIGRATAPTVLLVDLDEPYFLAA